MLERILNKAKKVWRHSPFGKTRKVDNPIRWGVIGLGYMAETFSCAIDGNKEGVVYAVASRSLDKAKDFAARHGGCKAYGSYSEMLNDKNLHLDIIYIATPVKCHYDHIKLCLEAGFNVLCEKPITSTSEQLDELAELARKNCCFLMEGMWMKCLPSFQKACSWIKEGRIGAIELVRADFYKREHIREGYAIYDAKAGGGVLHDYGVYAIAFMEHFLRGVPESISSIHRVSSYAIDSDWQISARRKDIQAAVNLSSDFGSQSKAAVIGKDGFIEWNSQFNRTNCVTLYGMDGLVKERFSVLYEYEGFEYEVDEVQKCIRSGMKESSVVSLEETRNTMHIIDDLSKTL